jgi:hypothetical protein
MIGSPVFRYALTPGWANNSLWRAARAVPSLDLRFAESKSLVDATTGQSLVTLTRASSGTYVGSDGLIKTATTNEARFDHNPTTGESLGLLVEEQRTNLLLNSATLSTQSVTVAAVAHTLSFYGTGTVTLSGVSTAGPAVGSGAYPTRTTLTFTPTAGSLTLTVTGSVTSAQLEAGAFPTSYIPTTTATVTRSADVASITGANFSSWYNADQGTFAFDAKSIGAGGAGVIGIGAGTGALYKGYTGVTRNMEWWNGTSVMSTSNSIDWSVQAKGAGAYASAERAISLNGGAVTTSATGLPNGNSMRVGATYNGSGSLNGTVNRITYWPTRLADGTLRTITQP